MNPSAHPVWLVLALLGTRHSPPADEGQDSLLQNEQAFAKAEELGLRFVAELSEQPEETDWRWLTDIAESVLERRERVDLELEGLQPELYWGSYCSGDGLGLNHVLTVGPNAGATYTWYGCMGLYDANHGSVVRVEDRTIYLDLAVDPALNLPLYWAGFSRPIMGDEWCVVDWGDRRYLVPAPRMIPFCNEVNAGRLPEYPARLLAGGAAPPQLVAIAPGWKRPDGLPRVPSRYRPFLLQEPIATRVVSANEPRLIRANPDGQPVYLVLAVIDAGRSDGLLPGMTLTRDGGGGVKAEVVSVVEGTARVRMVTRRLKPGDVLATGPGG
jgi:hypothetical protein